MEILNSLAALVSSTGMDADWRDERGRSEVWRFKGCPRCNGDIFLERDIGGWYERCLQCGHNQDLGSVVEVKQQATGREKELTLAGSEKNTAE